MTLCKWSCSWHSIAADHGLLSVKQTTYVAEDNVVEFTGEMGLMDDAYDGDPSIRHPEARTLPGTVFLYELFMPACP